jgi:CRP/FNR family transcriptional regulator, nitrogen fixation regulation protein
MAVLTHATRPTTAQTVLRATTPDTLNLLEQFGTTVHVGRDHEIYADGQDADWCYKVVSGCVRSVKLMEDGRRRVGEFFLPGDMFGLDALDTYGFATEAVSDAVLRRYPRRMVDALAESHAVLARRLREMAVASLRAAQARLMLLGRGTASERIAAFLVEMARRMRIAATERLELPMNRTDMADHLGLTVETICRVLSQMKRGGVVGATRVGVELRNRHALREMAGQSAA